MARKPPSRAALLLLLSLPSASIALHFPDTTELKKDWRAAARSPQQTLFTRSVDGDSASLAIDWTAGRPVAVRYEQGKEFDQDGFSELTAEFGSGGTWHEIADVPAAPKKGKDKNGGGSEAAKIYPGLQQQWVLKGYGDEKGWLGSGVLRGRYFLVFREAAPMAMAVVAEPLGINRGFVKLLDTSSQWLHVPCRKDTSGAAPKRANPAARKDAPVCFSPTDDSRLLIRIEKKSPLALDIWLEEEESESLQAIRKSVQTVSDASQHEYSQDLSQILQGEARMFLVKLAQRAPGLFNWPSWQLQDFKDGRVPESRYLEIMRSEREPADFLPALQYEGKGMRMTLDLYYRGAYHLSAQEKKP